ncbi:ADP-ribosylation factor-like protein 15 isoform X1 [Pangasianodon hypophthalmus]|uniref:ADP-ribosylation factor-like protein 15 isoform X1 n=1 Tax=Pangasianodon hypophthalmus TaxID=310915 RepID=UPI0023081CF4|nr:ADP-ribosylation factor-like protein 15 isoform X1 [Pangasianodon hypophthalmus]
MQSLYTDNSLGSLILQPGFHFPEDDGEISRRYMDYLCFRTLCCKGPPPPRPEYDVVCIGLTGSGKTSLLSRLCSEATDTIVPTTGFSIKAVPFQNAILNVKELGGADSIKKYWSRYYQGSQGVVFVLDSASSDEDLEAARTELHSALQHPQLCTLPFLILANQQDKPAARSVHEGTEATPPSQELTCTEATPPSLRMTGTETMLPQLGVTFTEATPLFFDLKGTEATPPSLEPIGRSQRPLLELMPPLQ